LREASRALSCSSRPGPQHGSSPARQTIPRRSSCQRPVVRPPAAAPIRGRPFGPPYVRPRHADQDVAVIPWSSLRPRSPPTCVTRRARPLDRPTAGRRRRVADRFAGAGVTRGPPVSGRSPPPSLPSSVALPALRGVRGGRVSARPSMEKRCCRQ